MGAWTPATTHVVALPGGAQPRRRRLAGERLLDGRRVAGAHRGRAALASAPGSRPSRAACARRSRAGSPGRGCRCRRADAHARLRDERRAVRPGDGLAAGAADGHALDAAGEAGVEVRLHDADGDHEVRLLHAPGDAHRGAQRGRRRGPRSRTRCPGRRRPRPARPPPARRAGRAPGRPVVACRPQPMATVTAASGTPAASSSSSSASRTGSLGQGREASGMVTTTDRAPRASSRRRGAPTGEASAAPMAAGRSASGSRRGRRLEGIGAGHGEPPRAAPDPRRSAHEAGAAPLTPRARRGATSTTWRCSR